MAPIHTIEMGQSNFLASGRKHCSSMPAVANPSKVGMKQIIFGAGIRVDTLSHLRESE
jgi:hypothetical protein